MQQISSYEGRVRFLIQDAHNSLMEKIREGECRMSFSTADWEAKLPPLKEHPEFPGLGQAKELEPVKLKRKKLNYKELGTGMARAIAIAQARQEEETKQLALW